MLKELKDTLDYYTKVYEYFLTQTDDLFAIRYAERDYKEALNNYLEALKKWCYISLYYNI